MGAVNEQDHLYDVIVVGGGASGLTAAIHAARKGAEVLLLEKTDAVGKKLSMTGNGRCNLSNMELEPSMYNDSAQSRLSLYLHRFGLTETLSFMESLGVVVQDEGGYLYPISGQATSIVNALRAECERLRVVTVTSVQVKDIVKESAQDGEDVFLVTASAGEVFHARSVIVSSGGLSGTKKCGCTGDAYYLLSQKGVTLTERYPALVPLLTDDETLPEKTGVRALATIRFVTPGSELVTEYGELQLTRGTLSGIPVLQASGAVAKAIAGGEEVTAHIDLFPAYDEEMFEELVGRVCENRELPGRDAVCLIDFLEGFHNRYINEMVLRKMKLSPSMGMRVIPSQMLESILRQYRKVAVNITGVLSYEKAQATAGGVDLSETDENLQLIKIPGLYVTGELLDVDGRCGGFNLQWAWTSGAIAGEAAAGRVK